MFRALFWKEWKQLGTLRWAGIALGVATPAIAAAGAEAGRRGWLFLVPSRNWLPNEVLLELSPAMVLLGVWPLMALLLTAQAFTADRAKGTEAFLRERPVPRGRIWLARLAAATASSLTLALVAGAVSLGIGVLGAGGSGLDTVLLGGFAAGGALASTVLTCGGLAASSMLRSPSGAVLIGLLLGAAPAVLATFLAAAFPFASVAGAVPIGAAVPWLLVPGYAAASWVAAVRGEPAGRGSLGRSLGVTALALALAALLFVGSATLAMHFSQQGWHAGAASPAGDAMTFGGWYSAPMRLVDTRTGKLRLMLPPPVHAVSWNDNGELLAVATSSGPLGSDRNRWRLEFYGSDGRKASRDLSGMADSYVPQLLWSGQRVVAVVALIGAKRPWELIVASPGDSQWQRVDVPLDGWRVQLVDGRNDGFLARVDKPKRRAAQGDEEPLSEILGFTFKGPVPTLTWRRTLSQSIIAPDNARSTSGRYLILYDVHRDDPADTEGGGAPPSRAFVRPLFLDLETNELTSLAGRAKSVQWLENDRIAWAVRGQSEEAMYIGSPGHEAEFLRAWAEARIRLSASPDRKRLLVTVRPFSLEDPPFPPVDGTLEPAPWVEGSAPRPQADEMWLYDTERRTWTSFETMPPGWDGRADWWNVLWAGSDRLVRLGRDKIAFESLDRPGELVWARGGLP